MPLPTEGQNILHPKWGRGRVVRVDGENVVVAFTGQDRTLHWPTIEAKIQVLTVPAADAWKPTAEEARGNYLTRTDTFQDIATIVRLVRARTGIPAGREHRPKNPVDGDMPCPFCTGTLRFGISSYNNHMHARCTSDGCVAFMM